MDIRKGDKYVVLSDLSICYIWKNKKKSHKNNKCKILGTIWDEEFEQSDGSCYVLDNQDYFKYIIKKHETLVFKPLVHVYVNKIQNRVTFKIKFGYYR